MLLLFFCVKKKKTLYFKIRAISQKVFSKKYFIFHFCQWKINKVIQANEPLNLAGLTRAVFTAGLCYSLKFTDSLSVTRPD